MLEPHNGLYLQNGVRDRKEATFRSKTSASFSFLDI